MSLTFYYPGPFTPQLCSGGQGAEDKRGLALIIYHPDYYPKRSKQALSIYPQHIKTYAS